MAPLWNLDSVYASFDSGEYKRDKVLLSEKIAFFAKGVQAAADLDSPLTTGALIDLLNAQDSVCVYADNLSAYAQAVYTTDTGAKAALAEINEIAAAKLPLSNAIVRFRALLLCQKNAVLNLAENSPCLAPYKFYIKETIQKAAFQMPPEMENLTNDLNRCGGDAWSRLHDALASTASAVWNKKTNTHKTINELRSMASDPRRTVRKKAYLTEIQAWKSIEIPMAAALNGVKGWTLTVDKRRGWENALVKSAFQSRISEKTLSALISAIESAIPLFRRYLKAKARLLKIKKCAFYDLFAPVGTSKSEKKWTWKEATAFVSTAFESFDPKMAEFACGVFAKNWVDAKIRHGKIGGAYCMDFPLAGESRILCNFDGSLDSVFTIAHETGHAWHHEIIKDLPHCLTNYPMTLAETASTFGETLVFERALCDARGRRRLSLIEANIKDCTQVLLDILSRFYFEKALFESRKTAELLPSELCSMMLDAQKKTYGDDICHPYMWAVKAHYYSPALAFYNYPYAFGQLLSLALLARLRDYGASFVPLYRDFLAQSGRLGAEEAVKTVGFDIENADFWQTGIKIIEGRIIEIEKFAA